jgi:hypothetical protein
MSARPLGRGRFPYPPEVCRASAHLGSGSGSAAGSAHLAVDAAAVVVDRLGDSALGDAIEVVDAPLELLRRLLGRKPVPSDLLRAPARLVVVIVPILPRLLPDRQWPQGRSCHRPAASVRRPAATLTRTASVGQARSAGGGRRLSARAARPAFGRAKGPAQDARGRVRSVCAREVRRRELGDFDFGFGRPVGCGGDFAADVVRRFADPRACLALRRGSSWSGTSGSGDDFAADLMRCFADPRPCLTFSTASSRSGASGWRGKACRRRTSPPRASNAPAPAYAPVTPSAAADTPGRRASKRINAAVPVPEASAASSAPPPTMATPGPAWLARAVSSRRATSTCSRAKSTACWDAACTNSWSGRSAIWSTPGTDIRPGYPRRLARKLRITAPDEASASWLDGSSLAAAGKPGPSPSRCGRCSMTLAIPTGTQVGYASSGSRIASTVARANSARKRRRAVCRRSALVSGLSSGEYRRSRRRSRSLGRRPKTSRRSPLGARRSRTASRRPSNVCRSSSSSSPEPADGETATAVIGRHELTPGYAGVRAQTSARRGPQVYDCGGRIAVCV